MEYVFQQHPLLQINAIFSNLFITQNSDFDKKSPIYKQEISHFIIYQQTTIAKTRPTITPAQPSITRNAVPTNLWIPVTRNRIPKAKKQTILGENPHWEIWFAIPKKNENRVKSIQTNSWVQTHAQIAAQITLNANPFIVNIAKYKFNINQKQNKLLLFSKNTL